MHKIFKAQKSYCACRVLSLATIRSEFYFNFILNRTRSGRELFDRPSYMGDGFYRSKDPTNSIKVLKEHIGHRQIKRTISRHINTKHSNPLVYTNMWWLGDGSHRGQVHHAWTAVGLPPWYADYTKLRDINNKLLRLLNCLGVFFLIQTTLISRQKCWQNWQWQLNRQCYQSELSGYIRGRRNY